jgi:hypothetical protein
MKKHRTVCVFPECLERKDEDRKTGLCANHSQDWFASKEWREATQDPNVRFWMGLKSEKAAMRVVNKYRKKWMKRVSEEEGA